jgi:ABC-type multidrug transport system ATPase subunit
MEILDLVIKVDGYPVVNDLTLNIEEGERVGIVGDFRDALFVMNTLCGLTLPDSGEIWIYNLPPRQALQRGLVGYIQQPTSTDSLPTPMLLLAHAATPQPHSNNTIVHPLPYIEIFNKLIHNNYKFINLIPKRRNELS